MLADRGGAVAWKGFHHCSATGAGCAGCLDWYTGRQDHCLAKVIVKCHYSEVQQQQVGDGFRPETNPGAVYP